MHFASGKFKMTMLLGLDNKGGENRRPINLNAMDKTCTCQLGLQGNLYFVWKGIKRGDLFELLHTGFSDRKIYKDLAVHLKKRNIFLTDLIWTPDP